MVALGLLSLLVLAQGSPTMAGPNAATRRRASAAVPADYYDSFLVGTFSECTNGAYTTALGNAVTVTRATSSYCTKSDGTMVLIGANKPVVEADGLAVWAVRTNLVQFSEAMNAGGWSSNGFTTVTADTHVAPNGATTAETLTLNAGSTSGQNYRYANAIAETAGVTYARSAYVQPGTVAYVTIYGSTNALSSRYSVFYLSGAGTVTDNGGSVGRIERLGSTNWYRIQTAATASSGVSSYFILAWGDTQAHALPGANWTAAGTESIIAWGAQTEVGSRASPYIPTLGSAVASAADVVSTTPSTSINSNGCIAATVTSTADSLNVRLASSGGAPSPLIYGAGDHLTGGFYYGGGYGDAYNAIRTTTSRLGLSTVIRSVWKNSPANYLNSTFNGVTGSDVAFPGGMNLSPLYFGSGGSDGWLNGAVKEIKWNNTYAGCTQ